jgi:hypothetical protein
MKKVIIKIVLLLGWIVLFLFVCFFGGYLINKAIFKLLEIYSGKGN